MDAAATQLAHVRKAVRAVALAGVALLLGVPQALWRIAAPQRLPGPLPRVFHRLVRGILGIRVDVMGTPAFGDATVWAGNHLSYLDIPLLGSLGPMRFVAKDEVAGWPLFGRLADLQRTIYISRRPREAVAAAGRFADAVRQGGVVVLFPEGTSSDGSAVLPFRASILQPLFDPALASARVQAFTLCLRSVDARDAGSVEVRDLYAYYGDIALVPHLRAFLGLGGADLRVVFHPPVRPRDFADRRALAAHLERQVAWGLVHGTPAA